MPSVRWDGVEPLDQGEGTRGEVYGICQVLIGLSSALP